MRIRLRRGDLRLRAVRRTRPPDARPQHRREFRAEFENFRANIQSSAEAAHIRAEANSADCRIVSGDDNRAEVDVDVVRTVTSDETDGLPQTSRMAMTVTVDNVDGRWLVSKVRKH
jgi:Mce-associated membrane protein